MWLNVTDSISDYNRVILSTHRETVKAYNDGKYVLRCDGKFIGSFSSEEVVKEAKKYEKCVTDY